MATRRSTIECEVLGLAELTKLNTALATHDRRIQSLTSTYAALNSVLGAGTSGVQRLGTTVVTVNNNFSVLNNTTNNTVNNITRMGAAAQTADRGFGGMLGTMVKYRAISAVFEGVAHAVEATVQAMVEMEKQSARVQRVSAPGSTAGIRADFAEEAARTGASIQDIGEAYYQLKTRIGDNATAFSALQTAMNLVVGTEADARQTTRAMLQVYAQFGDQLDKNVGQAENFRRIGELLAGTWKLADAEMVDITNSLKYLGPIAAAAKVPLEQVFGVMAALTAEGHRGRMSGTESAQFLSQIIKNYNSVTGEIENKGAHVKVALTADGGIDLQKTIENIVRVANSLPVEKARAFLLAISGTQNSFRFLGSSGPEFMALLTDAISKARQQLQGQTHDAEALRKTMTTTAQEGQRAFQGMFALISNMVDASPIRSWLRGIADDIEHAANVARQQVNTEHSAAGVLGGQGFGANAADNRRSQLLMQQSLLRGFLHSASDLHVSGRPSLYEWGDIRIAQGANQGVEDLYRDSYMSEGAPERGYLQRFLKFSAPPNSGQAHTVQMDLPAMQAELSRVTAEIAALRSAPSLAAGPVPSAASLGLHGLTPAQAENAAIIAAAAKKYGVDPLAMIAVANYESGLSASNRNPTSSATGLFQILRGTAPSIDRSNPYQNAEFAAREIARSGGAGLGGAAAIRMIVERFERPGAAATPGEEAGALRFYTNRGNLKGGGGVPGGYTDPKLEQQKKERERKAEEAERKAAELRQEAAERAQIEYERALKAYGPLDSRTGLAAQIAQSREVLAADSMEKLRIRYGLSGTLSSFGKEKTDALQERADKAKEASAEAQQKAEEAAKSLAERLQIEYEHALDLYGPGNRATVSAAQAAQAAAMAVADPNERLRLQYGLTGPVAGNAREIQQSADKARENDQARQSRLVEDIIGGADRRARSLERDARPNALFGSADARRGAVLEGTAATIQETIDKLQAIKDPSDSTARELATMRERLLDANAALVDFRDQMGRQQVEEIIKQLGDKYETRLSDIQNKNLPVVGETERQAAARERQQLQAKAELAEKRYQDFSALKFGLELAGIDPKLVKSNIEQADIDRRRAGQGVTAFDRERQQSRYEAVAGPLKSALDGSLMNFLHGQGGFQDVLRAGGDSIVNSVLSRQISALTDPLIPAIANQVTGTAQNTQALATLTDAINGVGGGGGAGAGAGGGGGAVGGRKGLLPGKGDKYLTEALAGYSVFSSGEQNGSSLGSVLGAAMAGGAIAGPIGAVVGGALNLIGGLFHHKAKDPLQEDKTFNPSLYNAPSQFEFNAYRYRATGQLPGDLGQRQSLTAAPIVQVFIDGAAVAQSHAVYKVLTKEGGTSRASMQGVWDSTRPT